MSPVFKQRRDARVSWRYVAEYRKGVDCCLAVQRVAQTASKRHRDTSDRRSRQAEVAMAAAAAGQMS